MLYDTEKCVRSSTYLETMVEAKAPPLDFPHIRPPSVGFSPSVAREPRVAAGVGSSYVESARQYLELVKSALAEVPSKISFCKQRQERAAKLQSLGAKVSMKPA